MNHTVKNLFFTISLLAGLHAGAQNLGLPNLQQGQLSGDFQANANAFDFDSIIGTSTTHYFHQKSSAEAWLYLNYRLNDFSATVRFDMFNNSQLLQPQEAYTRQGLAFYSISQKIGKFGITAGHFYDQFGSGIVFRAFEDRNLGLDYAIQGIRVQYSPDDSFMVKGFTGLQKNRFDVHPQVIKGLNSEKLWKLGPIGMITGGSWLNRTLDEQTMQNLASQINALPLEERFIPKYNVVAGSVYNTFAFKDISLYVEYARKTHEAGYITTEEGEPKLVNRDGSVLYGSLSYSFSGLGLNFQYKKIDNFALRTSPYTTFLVGLMNYLPALSRQHSFRLPARYSISAQPEGETGYQGEITYSLDKRNSFTGNISIIEKPNGRRIFREYYLDYDRRFNKKTRGIFGVQSLVYDQELYEFHPEAPVVHTITPFMEMSFRLDRDRKPDTSKRAPKRTILKPSIRFEAQYMLTEQDRGDFAFALIELNLAPKYSFAVSDMVNTRPTEGNKILHYYSVFAAYTENQTRFTAGYAKQVAGVVCTGGVCRVEPAFSGFRFGLSTNF